MFTFYTQEAVNLSLTASLPKPVDVCEECGGGFWKKIKKGSEIEKYLVFCRCNDSEDNSVVAIEPTSAPIIEKSQNDAEDEKPAEIPKHLRSRYKPNHHKARKWVSTLQNDD